MTLLVIAAHPDDEVLGCGGTVAKLARGQDVHVLILGEGVTARAARRRDASRGAVATLRREMRAAAAILGVRAIESCGLPDNRFDEVSLLDIVKRIERSIRAVQPQAVYTHHPGDVNIDHALTFRAVLTATRPLPDCSVRELYAFEVPSSTEWAFQRLAPAFQPNTFVDISASIDTKLQAMAAYASEVRPAPHPRSAESLRAMAARWGAVAGVLYAEAFELIRSVRE